MRCDLVRTSTLALAFVGSIGLAAAQQQPSPNASPPANAVLVNGALAVPGAPANTDTVPAKFSKSFGSSSWCDCGYQVCISKTDAARAR